ncbi:MAG: entericidin A/B family lipoprotein [Geminicoccales bacterium]
MSRAQAIPRTLSTPAFWFLSALLLLLGMSTLSACNTISGAGQDVEAAGDAVSDTAEDAKD